MYRELFPQKIYEDCNSKFQKIVSRGLILGFARF